MPSDPALCGHRMRLGDAGQNVCRSTQVVLQVGICALGQFGAEPARCNVNKNLIVDGANIDGAGRVFNRELQSLPRIPRDPDA